MAALSEFTLVPKYQTDQRGPVRWLFSHASNQWPLVLMALVGALANAGLASVIPIMIGRALNVILASPVQVSQLGAIALTLVFAQIGRGLLQLARNFSFEILAQRIERYIRNELYVSLLGKSMTFHGLQPVGDTMARATNDVREVNFLFSPGLNLVTGSIIFLFIPLLVAPTFNQALILTPILFIISYAISLRFYLKSLEPVTDEIRSSFGKMNTRLAEALDGIETVKGSSQESSEVKLFALNAVRYRSAVIKQGDIEAKFIPGLLYDLALGFGLFHSLLLFQQGYLNIGQVVGYFGILLLLDFPTFISLFAYSQIASGLAGARRILDLMTRENNLDQNISGYAGSIKGEVEFRNVNFAYANGEPVLQNATFKVKPGQTVAIVGQTGAGKTSFTRLINRTYDISSGHVLVDGIDVREWNLESLRQNISIIEQDIFLFSRSILENIGFGCPGADEEDIKNAASLAQADEFIQSFTERYQTVIGERGVTLSGGQRQRIALARAFLTDPKILILDDSTSAIDSATEDKIQQAIFTAARGRTTFIITHRLSQIRWADLIIVLRKGRISAIGTHDELMQKSDAYRQIFAE